MEDQEVKLEYQGGYVMELHRLAQAIYGPGSPLDPKGQVFEFLKHTILRNNGDRKPLGTADIMKATGLGRRQTERALAFLIKGDFIIVHHRKTKMQLEKNSYELHPRLFGNDYIYNGIRKPLRVIQGGKTKDSSSYPPKDKTYPQRNMPMPPPYRQNWGYPTDKIGGTLPTQMVESELDPNDEPSAMNPVVKPSLGRIKKFDLAESDREPSSWELEEEKIRQIQELKRQEGKVG